MSLAAFIANFKTFLVGHEKKPAGNCCQTPYLLFLENS